VESVVNNEVVSNYKERGGSIQVTAINSDFELSIISAFHDTLNSLEGIDTSAECCYFHFRKALLDKIKELGLANVCYAQPETRVYSFLKALAALAFIPPNKVLETYVKIKSDRDNFTPKANLLTRADQEKVAAFIKYFEQQYLGVTQQHARGNIVVVRRWNCNGREDTTNSHVEAWHSSKKTEFSRIRHIFKFIVACQESASQDIIKLNHIRNNTFHPQKTSMQSKREKIMKHIQELYAIQKISEIDVVKAIMTVI